MWGMLWDAVKGLFGGKGNTAIGYDNKNQSGTTTGDNSPALNAGRDLIYTAPLPSAIPPKSRQQELIDWMRQNGYDKPLSQVMLCALEYAQLTGANNFLKWLNLETHGYDQKGGMTEKDVVPEYRDVKVTYLTSSRHTWNADYNKYYFVNNYRLRDSVSVLESLAAASEPIPYTDDEQIKMIREHFRVNVVAFFFSHVDVIGLLTTIRSKTLEKFSTEVMALSASSPKSLT